MISISILFFANFKTLTGTNRVNITVPAGTKLSDLKNLLIRSYPSLEFPMMNVLSAINQEYILDDALIPDNCEVAFFPPVSGGTQIQETIIKITTESLDLDRLIEKITFPSTGAACIFTGMVREITSRGISHKTDYLEYEAFIPMAESKMQQIANEIRHRWPSIEGIIIIQRIGKLSSQTPTIIIACSAAHRDTGIFEAARYGIDRVKEIVPIWKKEIGPDGEKWIEGEYHPKAGD
jgi:MoaE-MoaD fusion protein